MATTVLTPLMLDVDTVWPSHHFRYQAPCAFISGGMKETGDEVIIGSCIGLDKLCFFFKTDYTFLLCS